MENTFLEIGIKYQDEAEKMFTGVTFELLRWFQILKKRERVIFGSGKNIDYKLPVISNSPKCETSFLFPKSMDICKF